MWGALIALVWCLRATARSANDETTIWRAAGGADTQAVFPGGTAGTEITAWETYIREHRQQDFLDNLSRKLLAYALGLLAVALR